MGFACTAVRKAIRLRCARLGLSTNLQVWKAIHNIELDRKTIMLPTLVKWAVTRRSTVAHDSYLAKNALGDHLRVPSNLDPRTDTHHTPLDVSKGFAKHSG